MRLQGNGFYICPLDDTPADRAAVLAVYQACEDFLALGPVAAASMAMVLADLDLSAQAGGTFCAIRSAADDRMLGVVDFVTTGWQGDPALAFLELLMIAAPERGHGLGAAVVAAVEAEIARGPARAVAAGVQVNNPGAIRFWTRLGYQITSGPIHHPDGTTAFDLYKPLP